MQLNHVEGRNKGKVFVYALSTCIWCKKTLELLSKLNVAYDYIYVDLLDADDKERVYQEMLKYNPRGSFPTVVINDSICITGFDET
ncbi:MAG: glutaredoxin family protein, partial [candidate division WOR-3 bacterium]|nr:glutaredoxin family protein [candidate division WOR-3 bacterium]